jgi:four helix bundle protein
LQRSAGIGEELYWVVGGFRFAVSSINMGSYKDLLLYKKSFSLAMEIYAVTKLFPKEETYSLTDQIRRSSRSVNICTIEAYRKRRFPNHFVSKLTDVDMENSETQGWLEFSLACNYITKETYNNLFSQTD